MKPRRTAVSLLLAAASFAVAPAKPAHLVLADRMVADVKPANNMYANGTATVTWAGVHGKTLTYNKSDCTTFVTALLKTGYGFTSEQFETWFHSTSPAVTTYYSAALANSGLQGFKQIAKVQPGDLLISKYVSSTTGAAGHMMVVDAAPVLVSTSATQRTFNVTVVDCTGSPHYADTRVKPQSGAGRGTMRVYTDLSGNLLTWGWGTGTPYAAADRPITFAKVPSVNRMATASR